MGTRSISSDDKTCQLTGSCCKSPGRCACIHPKVSLHHAVRPAHTSNTGPLEANNLRIRLGLPAHDRHATQRDAIYHLRASTGPCLLVTCCESGYSSPVELHMYILRKGLTVYLQWWRPWTNNQKPLGAGIVFPLDDENCAPAQTGRMSRASWTDDRRWSQELLRTRIARLHTAQARQ